MLLFVPPFFRCHDDGRFRFTVIGYGLGLAVTSRFLWTAPYTNEILDVNTSKTGEHEPPDEEERCLDERAQLQPFWAVFHAILEETSFITHLHKSDPSLLFPWERNE